MAEELMPYQMIELLVEQRKSWSDEAILAELTQLAVLPDEDDPAWDDDRTWDEQANLFVALGDLAAERRLLPALPLLLERACYGDPGEMMRGLRTTLERIVNPDSSILTEVCIKAAQYPQRGARLWAVNELRILRDPSALSTLIAALQDTASTVRLEACWALVNLCDVDESCRPASIEALTQYIEQEEDSYNKQQGRKALADIKGLS